MNRSIVLASSSPRRQELLRGLGLAFEICALPVDESVPGAPEQVVVTLAERKARAALAQYPNALIIGADTLVGARNETLGKPTDEEDAYRMLSLLQGGWHSVHSGVCLIDGPREKIYLRHEVTHVEFVPLSPSEIRAYIATGEPFDKAGAYALQGIAGMFVSRIDGSSSNVIGLPLAALREMLLQADFKVLG